MVAELFDQNVIIHDISEGNRIYSKGCFGSFNHKLVLDLIEACYLLEKDRIDVRKDGKKVTLKKFMEHALSFMPDFEIKYLVYRDMRERGYVVRHNEHFDVHARGKKPPSKSTFRLTTVSERAPCTIKDINAIIMETDLKVLIGIVDEEGDVTYYIAKFFEMKGVMPEREYSGSVMLINDRCITWDEKLLPSLKEDHIGKDFGSYVQLSLTEASYLLEHGVKVMRDGHKISIKRFIAHAKEIQPDIKTRLTAYKSLRNMKLLPKTGFKFGSHFRVYTQHPDDSHAPYLVHVVESNYCATWAEISRAVRLAHSVKKEMVFCVVDKKEIKYIRLKRITP